MKNYLFTTLGWLGCLYAGVISLTNNDYRCFKKRTELGSDISRVFAGPNNTIFVARTTSPSYIIQNDEAIEYPGEYVHGAFGLTGNLWLLNGSVLKMAKRDNSSNMLFDTNLEGIAGSTSAVAVSENGQVFFKWGCCTVMHRKGITDTKPGGTGNKEILRLPSGTVKFIFLCPRGVFYAGRPTGLHRIVGTEAPEYDKGNETTENLPAFDSFFVWSFTCNAQGDYWFVADDWVLRWGHLDSPAAPVEAVLSINPIPDFKWVSINDANVLVANDADSVYIFQANRGMEHRLKYQKHENSKASRTPYATLQLPANSAAVHRCGLQCRRYCGCFGFNLGKTEEGGSVTCQLVGGDTLTLESDSDFDHWMALSD